MNAGNGTVAGMVGNGNGSVFGGQGDGDLCGRGMERVKSEMGVAVPRFGIGIQLDLQRVVFYGNMVAVLRHIFSSNGKFAAILNCHVGVVNVHEHRGKCFRGCVGLVDEVQVFPIAVLIQCSGTNRCTTANRSGTKAADTGNDPRFHFHFFNCSFQWSAMPVSAGQTVLPAASA